MATQEDIKNLRTCYNALKGLEEIGMERDTELKGIVSKIKNILEMPYSMKFERLYLLDEEFPYPTPVFDNNSLHIAYAIIEDQLFKWECKKETKQDLELLKLLNAREENSDFEYSLGLMICGDNPKFPYRSSYYLSKFFEELGFPFHHNGETRRFWVQKQLVKCNIKDIYKIIKHGIFIRKNFDNDAKIEVAQEELKNLIEDSIKARDTIDLSSLFNINVKNELLFNKEITTEDKTLNELIETSRKLFLQGEKQLAIEKLWDAFERMKTYISLHKKHSADEICSILSSELDKQYFDSEFQTLTEIGNNYQIRHFEREKKPITDGLIIEYLYFRMLSLLDIVTQKLSTQNM